MNGTAALIRFHLRRDRLRIAVWVLAIALLNYASGASVKGLYPTQADLDNAAASFGDNPAALVFNGPAQALDTLGGQIAFQIGAFGFSVAGLMSLLMLNRLTRAEEESGRLELVRSMAVGRHAPLAAAVLVVATMNLAVGALLAALLVGLGLPVAGSVCLGAGFACVGLVFTAVAAITAQVTENPRVAAGSAGAVLALAFVVRAVGDVGSGALSWLSPIGLAQKARPFAGDRWWPLLLALVLAGVVGAVAAVLAGRRDFDAGFVAPRPGPAVGGLRSTLGLALRLQRGSVLWWSLGTLLTGATYGSITDSIEDFVDDSEALADILASAGIGSLTDSYLATSLLTIALVATGFAISSVLRLRSEESALRAEALLATPVSRARWVTSHVTVALGGTAVVMLAGGFGTGVLYAVVGGGADEVLRLVGASAAHVPAVWLVAGIAVALFGLLPRWALLAWAVLAGAFVLAMFGSLFDLPQWVFDLSPFEHTPQVPASDVTVLPLALQTAAAAALLAVGYAAFARRDLST